MKYYWQARLRPTLLTGVPLFILISYLITSVPGDIPNINAVWQMVAKIVPYTVFLFLAAQINRLIGKEIFERIIFKEGYYKPEISYLLWTDPFLAPPVKKEIRHKLLTCFNIPLPDQLTEVQDEGGTRKLTGYAVSQVKNALRDNKAVLRHNMEYKFVRNLIGGSLPAAIFSLLNIYTGHVLRDLVLMNAGIIGTVVYTSFLLFSKVVLRKFSRYYATVLYREFLSL